MWRGGRSGRRGGWRRGGGRSADVREGGLVRIDSIEEKCARKKRGRRGLVGRRGERGKDGADKIRKIQAL